MEFPLNLSFKIVALAPQIQVTDASGNSLCYVRQKLLKLKEAVEVFTDSSRSQKLCDLKADRIIDFSAKYRFTDCSSRQEFGSIKRRGMRSLWKSHYEISDANDEIVMEIREENPWAKVVDSLVGEIPIIGVFTGYFFHPSFLISRVDGGTPLIRVKKQPAFWEGKFVLEKLGEFDQTEELRMVMATLMMSLLERRRG